MILELSFGYLYCTDGIGSVLDMQNYNVWAIVLVG